ncbi:hypothetical protein V6M85_00030 [Sulfolobus tengchongensis]|uniref:Uncharacterized protein n=1 Tax=Sulfolobus tengchongensis TaxID=207809 RepID=A0AAX4L289_9CREN
MIYTIDELVRAMANFRHKDLKDLPLEEQRIVCDFISRLLKADPEAGEDFDSEELKYCERLLGSKHE